MKRGLQHCLLATFLLLCLITAAQAQGAAPQQHTVIAGETLALIAERYGVSVAALVAANQIADPNLIIVGQQLTIPAAGAGVVPSAFSPPDVIRVPLRPGDTLSRIARRYDVDPTEIMALNGIDRPRLIELEDEILLPVLPTYPRPFLAFTHSAGIVQGQTGVAAVTLANPEQPGGQFGEQTLHFVYRDKTRAGYRYWALLPTGALAPPGPRPLTVWVGETRVHSSVPILAGVYETQYIVLPPAKGELLQPARQRNELEILTQIWSTVTPEKQWRGPFRFPIAAGFLSTSPYGVRRSYNQGPVRSFHEGTDWSAAQGTPIWAPAAGVVVLAEMLDVRGGGVIIDHGLGVYSNFWHLSAIDVQPGQRVQPGDEIGDVGTTGLSTGAHLHWEIRVNGVAVDPLQWTTLGFPYAPMIAATEKAG
ncbi:MAG: peptidoglycan DD-metalloendopeptidase family protein [Caldilineales bacterium]|nr:peptidoglycan DD-metalloendopeptidase family protein [Caldilineales bacterium]